MTSCKQIDFQLEQLMPVIRESIAAGQSFWLRPKGTSMLPMIRQGKDSVRLSPVPGKLKKYDLPLYQRENGQYVLHRIVKVADTYTCVGDNQFDLEKDLKHEQMIAVVTAFARGKKKHYVTELSYRVYCRFWHYSRPIRQLWRKVLWRLRRLIK